MNDVNVDWRLELRTASDDRDCLANDYRIWSCHLDLFGVNDGNEQQALDWIEANFGPASAESAQLEYGSPEWHCDTCMCESETRMTFSAQLPAKSQPHLRECVRSVKVPARVPKAVAA